MTASLFIQLGSVVLMASMAAAQQGYGLSYPPQFFYLAPNDAAIVLAQHAATVAPLPTPAKTLPIDLAEGETAQFHSQDSKGRSVFGFLLPDQTRVEERGQDGSVRGAYSYLDPTGKAVKVQYWDNGSGFHSAGNNLPALSLGLPQQVHDTSEVHAAKEQHFSLVQQALLQHLQHLKPVEITVPGAATLSDNSVQSYKPDGATLSDSVVVESDGHNGNPDSDDSDSELTRYPNLQQFPQNLYDPTHVHVPNKDAVIVDSSDFDSNNLRTGKSAKIETDSEVKTSSDADSKTHSDDKIEPSETKVEEKITSSQEEQKIISSDETSTSSDEKSTSSDEKSTSSDETSTSSDEKSISNDEESVSKEGSDNGGKDSEEKKGATSKSDDNKLAPVRNRGFFYSFQHPIPIYVQVKTIGEEAGLDKVDGTKPEPLSHSQKAAYFGSIPVAAVHNFQVPPWQHDAFRNAGLPLYTAPIPQSNSGANVPLTYSQKAFYFGAVPVAAVHDQQAHPNQRGSFSDHQTAPLYIEPNVEDN